MRQDSLRVVPAVAHTLRDVDVTPWEAVEGGKPGVHVHDMLQSTYQPAVGSVHLLNAPNLGLAPGP